MRKTRSNCICNTEAKGFVLRKAGKRKYVVCPGYKNPATKNKSMKLSNKDIEIKLNWLVSRNTQQLLLKR